MQEKYVLISIMNRRKSCKFENGDLINVLLINVLFIISSM